MDYDLVIVGGGLAGAALATALAAAGRRVLVLERETAFRDRVRGEVLHPWGVAEARQLGILDRLLARPGHPLPVQTNYRGDAAVRRDLVATTPAAAGQLAWYHPAMQETVLALAAETGAAVNRGATVIAVTPGTAPRVSIQRDGTAQTVTARLVVGADGRDSRVRRWGDFAVRRDPDRIRVSGVLLEGVTAAEDSSHLAFAPIRGELALLFPQGRGRARAYVCTARRDRPRLDGARALPDFLRMSAECGLAAAWFAGATAVGPLATFEGAAAWVERPYQDGVALVGDAAATADPTWGCGQSLALRDVRLLRDALLAETDWDVAGRRYAAAHDRTWAAMHTIETWMSEIFFTPGSAGEAIRARALPNVLAGHVPDFVGLGPDAPADEGARRRLFGS